MQNACVKNKIMTFSNKFMSKSPLRQEENPKTTDTLNPKYYKPKFDKSQKAPSIEQLKKDSEKYKVKRDNFDEEFEKLENLRKNSEGKTVEYGSPEYERLYNEGSITGVTTDGKGNYRPIVALDEVDLGTVSKKRNPSKKLDYISDGLTLAGMSPGYGALADAGNLIFATGRTVGNAIGDTYQGLKTGDFDYGLTGRSAKDIGWAAAGLIPITGQLSSSSKIGSRLMKGAQRFQKSKGLDIINKIHHSKLYYPTKTGKVAYKNTKKNLPKEETS